MLILATTLPVRVRTCSPSLLYRRMLEINVCGMSESFTGSEFTIFVALYMQRIWEQAIKQQNHAQICMAIVPLSPVAKTTPQTPTQLPPQLTPTPAPFHHQAQRILYTLWLKSDAALSEDWKYYKIKSAARPTAQSTKTQSSATNWIGTWVFMCVYVCTEGCVHHM